MPSITFWTRLEPRTREGTMERSLRAQIRDPLWMLARQWQVGEFRGDDAGSPIQATYRVESVSLTSYQPGLGVGQVVPLDESLPLEAHVEREAVTLGLRGSVQLGLRFEALMDATGFSSLIPAFRTAYPIPNLPPGDELPDAPSRQFRLVVAGRVTDGNLLYAAAKAAITGQPVSPPLPIPSGDQPGVLKVLQDFVAFRDSLYSEPVHDLAWVPQQLEYQFSVGSQSSSGNTALVAPEFRGGHLDWYSFAVSSTPVNAGNPTTVQVQDRAIIPNHVTFRGEPKHSWWKFEDGNTDYGQLDTEHVDLAKMLVMEFALVYGNDWFELPLQLPVGSLSKVTLLLVTDTFGERTLIRPTLEQTPSGQQPWSMFTISGDQTRSDYLFLPPTLEIDTTMDGPVLEDILLLRDEMAAMAWAVERTLQGPLDVAVDGYESYILRLTDQPPPGPPTAAPDGPKIYYLLGTTVPDNWIPLVLIKTPNQAYYFRRGVIERPGLDNVLPRALVLEPGSPFFVADQVVPPAGAEVKRRFRRNRWSDGSTFVWMAREKQPGRGPGWSGLAFDVIVPMGQLPPQVSP